MPGWNVTPEAHRMCVPLSTARCPVAYRNEQKGGGTVGLYKICEHDGRARDRCAHTWWGSFRGVRVSLAKWTNREIESKAMAGEALDELKRAIRNGTFDGRGLEPPRDVTTLRFHEFAEIYKQRHVQAKGLAM